MEITVTMKVPESTLGDLLICALEGGSDYWIGSIKPTKYEKRFSDICWYEDIFKQNGEFEIRDQWEDFPVVTVNTSKAVDGLQKMLKECPHLIDDYLSDNMDTEFADLWLQFTVYGECVYS